MVLPSGLTGGLAGDRDRHGLLTAESTFAYRAPVFNQKSS